MSVIENHPSPNHSSRNGHAVRLLLIHATAGSYTSALNELTSPIAKVSSHYLIRRDGHIARLVEETQAAWHAGVAVWQGETDVNAISIGIELENANNGRDPYPPAQVKALLDLTRDIQTRYPSIAFARHLDVARPVGRKTDPAGFQWAAYVASVTPSILHTVTAGKAGAIAQEDRRPGALAARYYAPGERIVCDDLQQSYWHCADGSGFIANGMVQP